MNEKWIIIGIHSCCICMIMCTCCFCFFFFYYYLVTKTVLLDKYFASGWVRFSFNFKFIYIYKNKIETGSYQFALSFFYRISSIAVFFFWRNAQEIYEETKQAYRLRARISLIKNCTITNIWMNMRCLFYFTVFLFIQKSEHAFIYILDALIMLFFPLAVAFVDLKKTLIFFHSTV